MKISTQRESTHAPVQSCPFNEKRQLYLNHTNFSMLLFFFSEDGYDFRDDDFIFEDFARLRLKGHEGDDTEA